MGYDGWLEAAGPEMAGYLNKLPSADGWLSLTDFSRGENLLGTGYESCCTALQHVGVGLSDQELRAVGRAFGAGKANRWIG